MTGWCSCGEVWTNHLRRGPEGDLRFSIVSTLAGCARSLSARGYFPHGLIDTFAGAVHLVHKQPTPNDAVILDAEDRHPPRISSRVPSTRVPCQYHSCQVASSPCAERTSSARKSGTPSKTAASLLAPAEGPLQDDEALTGLGCHISWSLPRICNHQQTSLVPARTKDAEFREARRPTQPRAARGFS
jgi:hypothetical protein